MAPFFTATVTQIRTRTPVLRPASRVLYAILRNGMSLHDELTGVLRAAGQIPALASFLTRVFSDPVLAGVFLLHRDELFQRVTMIEGGVTIHLGTTGLPLLSHRGE